MRFQEQEVSSYNSYVYVIFFFARMREHKVSSMSRLSFIEKLLIIIIINLYKVQG